MTSSRMVWLSGAMLALLAPAAPVEAATTSEATSHEPASFVYPQRREVEGYSLLIHAPQIRAWPDFQSFEAEVALELTPPGASRPLLGTAQVSGPATLYLPERLVLVRSPVVGRVEFADDATAADTAAVKRAARQGALGVPLDLFLAYLTDDVLSNPPPAGFNTSPPPIEVRSKPSVLLFVNGRAVPSEIPGTGLELIVNASWPTVRDPAGPGAYYLLERDRWLTSRELEGPWSAAKSLPAGFAQLPAGEEYAAIRSAVPLEPSSRPLPSVLFASTPTELIVTDGPPALETIPETGGLQRVRNTDSPLFKLQSDWYFLVAGRWFFTRSLERGPWSFAQPLPEAFAKIPEDDPSAAVRASVPGTVEAKMAALEASLPTRTQVRKGSAPPVEVTYAGEPDFAAIPGTQVARGVNTGFDVLRYESRYYLCYAAAWYVATTPRGPWAATADVPRAIYEIPPSSPSFAITDVKVEQSAGDSIEYSSTAAYATGMFVAFGVAYYGTGWYYPPYYYPPYYYPYWPTYGHGSWYNPATGRYGSRSVWAGPYGGYSYNQAYNPRTGRYGYVETAWDGDEWASFGESYNPRTGIGTETERYYNEDKNRATMERTTERGDEWLKTERTRDFDEGKTTVDRETSGGGSSQTVRQDGNSIKAAEGAGGGQAISVSGEGPGRTTIAQSGSGDLYAGHDGSVYKKTDDGWQQYGGGEWSPAGVDDSATRQTQGRDVGAEPTARASYPTGSDSRPSSYEATSRASQPSSLDRDHAARQRGNAQFQQRTAGRGGRRGR